MTKKYQHTAKPQKIMEKAEKHILTATANNAIKYVQGTVVPLPLIGL